MIILDRAQFLEHVRVGTVFWYLSSHDGEYTLHGPHLRAALERCATEAAG